MNLVECLDMPHKFYKLAFCFILTQSLCKGWTAPHPNETTVNYENTTTSAKVSDDMLYYAAPGTLAAASLLYAGKIARDAYKNTAETAKPYWRATKKIVSTAVRSVGESAAVWGLTDYTKKTLGHERPEPAMKNPCRVNRSMPSGHTSMTTVWGARAGKLLADTAGITRKAGRYAAEIGGGLVMGAITGAMRVEAKEHWPQDVVVGAAYGMLPTVSNIIDENSEQIGKGLTRAANAVGGAVQYCRGKPVPSAQEVPMRPR